MPKQFSIQDANEDHVAWGQLVKHWVKNPTARPTTRTELENQIAKASIRAEIASDVQSVAFVETSPQVLTIKLPSQDMLDEADMGIMTSNAYQLPSFYNEFYQSPVRRADLDNEEKRKLHAARIGEYSVNTCM